MGGIYNFVTKRGACRGDALQDLVDAGGNRLGSITWKYPSCILQGDHSIGEFYSVAMTNNHQQADTGTKMVHIGKNTRSTIISKGISAGKSQNTYRGAVKHAQGRGERVATTHSATRCSSATNAARTHFRTSTSRTRRRSSNTRPRPARSVKTRSSTCSSVGSIMENAVSLIVNGFCKEVFRELPMEFAVEAQKLLGISLEGTVG